MKKVSDFFSQIGTKAEETFSNLSEQVNSGKCPIYSKYPTCDLEKTTNNYIYHIAIPGISQEDMKDITVCVANDQLTVEYHKAHNIGNDRYVFRENTISSFKRTFELEKDALPDNINALMKNGILQIIVERKAVAKPRVINITFDG